VALDLVAWRQCLLFQRTDPTFGPAGAVALPPDAQVPGESASIVFVGRPIALGGAGRCSTYGRIVCRQQQPLQRSFPTYETQGSLQAQRRLE